MIFVFTDMGERQGVVALSYIIMTTSEHICSESYTVPKTSTNTSDYEILAIYEALRRLNKEVKSGTEVTVVSDSMHALEQIKNKKYKKSILRAIRKLAAPYCIDYCHIRSHNVAVNPNVVVDNMCTAKIREVLSKSEKSI